VYIVIALACAYVGHLYNQNNTLKSEAIQLHKDVQTEKDNVVKLQSAITEQNTAIDTLKNAAVVREQKAEVDLKIARNSANLHTSNAQTILSATPQNTNMCESANRLINKVITQ
jgi:hypothetical protein